MTATPDDPSTPVAPDEVTGAPPPGGVGELLGGAEGGFDFGSLLEQATQMQAQMAEAQQEAAESTVEGVAGGGVVKVVVSGAMEFRSVTIDPDAVDPDDVEMLQDLVLAALHDAVEQVNELQAGAMGGLDLGGLGGLLGGDG